MAELVAARGMEGTWLCKRWLDVAQQDGGEARGAAAEAKAKADTDERRSRNSDGRAEHEDEEKQRTA